MRVYNDFESLPHRRGYGIISLSCKEEIDSIMNSIVWHEVSFPSTNGAYNLRFDLIQRVIWERLSGECKSNNSIITLNSFFGGDA
jgi:hypothetical protein